MKHEWKEIKFEKTRKTVLKSQPCDCILLHDVTHFQERSHGFLLKCKEGIAYFEKDDIACIISDCDDWVV